MGVALTALPEFLLASALLIIFAVQLQWLPPYGWTGLKTAILPALSLGIPAGGLFGRLLADAVSGVADERWVAVCTAAYERVVAGHGGRSLRPYAGVNPAEFFAVATEAFFEAPRLLHGEHRELYEVLAGYYAQDPLARWS